MVDKVGISMLRYSGVDVDAALERFCNNSALYEQYLKKFLDDTTFAEMVEHIKQRDFERGYTGCHALKGVTGNLGFTELYEACNELCKALKTGVPAPIAEACEKTQHEYDEICKIVRDV